MPSVILPGTVSRALLPLCFALRRDGRWIGVCRFDQDEHHTQKRFGTRAAALADARRIAATLTHRSEVQS